MSPIFSHFREMQNSSLHVVKPVFCINLSHNLSRQCSFSSNFEDIQSMKKPRHKWALYDERATNIEPNKTSVILFPGQGSHFVGMGRDLIKLPKIKQMFQCANEILRTDILRTCLEGPASKLSKTIHCQPATFIISLAALAKLREENDELIRNCVATAGFSLGEISALVFSGALTYEEGLHIIRVRAEAMQKACDEKAGSMITVFVNPGSPIKLLISAAINHCNVHYKMQNPCCEVANYLYPDCKVISGNKEAIDFIEDHAVQFGIRRTKRLQVNGAFHTPLMFSAWRTLKNSMRRMGDFREPSIPVVSAVDMLPYRNTSNIKRKLAIQIVRPVKWEQTLYALYDRPPDVPFPRTIEPGPGRQLGAMLRMVSRGAFASYSAVDV
ncbi:Malonyl-CoA-acyl carrier protein transacylase, mitochondrial [Schistosoma japonicum]|nr:Malonyl-CoA-acyl carrier protein transacylase, mitochondrial [Schistosoma japonicum]KAH8860881.1 Malonyl-CoA-acyl carrier protein transacylase, mitochondrial [Schistosoma japonicum]